MEIDPATGLGTIAAIAKTIQSLIGLARTVNNAEVNQKLIELQTLVLEMQSQLIQLQNEKEQLRDEAKDLHAKLAIKGKMYTEYGIYWTIDDGKHDGPFCHVCWDEKAKLMRMTYGGYHHMGHTQEKWRSYNCAIHKVSCVIPVRLLEAKGLLFDDTQIAP